MLEHMKVYTIVADVETEHNEKFQSCLNVCVTIDTTIEEVLGKHLFILKKNSPREDIKINNIISITQVLDKVFLC